MSEANDISGGCGGGSAPAQPCACCAALAQVRMPWLPREGAVPGAEHYYGQYAPAAREPEKKEAADTSFFKFPGLGKKKSKESQKFSGKHRSSKKDADTPKNGASDADSSDGDESVEPWNDDLSVPQTRKLWQGLAGVGAMSFGVVIPAFMVIACAVSAPKRLTLVILNHPLESLLELGLIVSIPLVNFLAWKAICQNRATVSRFLTMGLGSSVATSLVVAGICIGALFTGQDDLAAATGTDFSAGFTWIAALTLLAGAVSGLLVRRLRAHWAMESARLRVLAQAFAGVVLSLLAFTGSEYRPWCVRIAEHMAGSASKQERQAGLDWLRQLNPERELRMECADDRAAGVSGLFFPLKASTLHQLYFSLTGTPYSFRDMNAKDLSALPDDYLSRHVVGDRIKGLTLTRSTISGPVHPNTLSSTVSWTFVLKNETASSQEARAEIGLPPGAALTGLTVWKRGEPTEAEFLASGRLQEAQSYTGGHDSPAMATDLGHGRVLMHCYPVPPEEELKVQISMVLPLKPEGMSDASLVMPQLIATNFSLSGEHQMRLRSAVPLKANLKRLSVTTASSGEKVLSGPITAAELEGSPIVVTASHVPQSKVIAFVDPVATKLHDQDLKRKEEQRKRAEAEENRVGEVVVMVDGSQAESQLEQIQNLIAKKQARNSRKPKVRRIQPVYVTEKVERVAAPAPKHLVVVLDGSVEMQKNIGDVTAALQKLPASIPTSVIIASQEQPELMVPELLSKRLANLKSVKFVGGQDNLQAVVKAAELAGEAKGGAVLWIHGPQPVINEEIYIISPYAAAPSFYELPLGSGTDTFEFFKNHTEIGPFSQVPRTGSAVSADLADFFAKWNPDTNTYVRKLATTLEKPESYVVPTEEEQAELRALQAIQLTQNLVSQRKLHKAARVAMAYRFVSPVSCALVGASATDDHSDEEDLMQENTSTLQGASNGTIGPNGDTAVINGVNTAGTVRVNNLANLEALLNIFVNLGEIGGLLMGVILVIHGFTKKMIVTVGEFEFGPAGRITIGAVMIACALALPGIINWFVASARDANLFS